MIRAELKGNIRAKLNDEEEPCQSGYGQRRKYGRPCWTNVDPDPSVRPHEGDQCTQSRWCREANHDNYRDSRDSNTNSAKRSPHEVG
jgi:hypothetical protein